jgi:hypothetical protein
MRGRMRMMRYMALAGYVLLDVIMKAPAYYIIARIDIAGGSTGWHRAALIESAIAHLNEWWLGGTDYTRHWMPTGVSWSARHTDLTNHYIFLGVAGGLPLMLLFIAILWRGFSYVGQYVKQGGSARQHAYLVWCLGASLFAQATTCISVAYFDQSFVFLYLPLAALGTIASREFAPRPSPATRRETVSPHHQPYPRC